MTPLMLGVVGCGAIATKAHIPAFKELGNVVLRAAVDVRQDLLRDVQGKFKFSSVATDYREIADLVDAVVVSTPNHTHYEIARFFLDCGKHVLIEKPITTTYASTTELYETAEANGVKLMVGFSRRFSENIRLLREITDPFTPKTVFASLGGDIKNWPAVSSYRTSFSEAGGGCIIDQGIHLIDTAIWFFGTKPHLSEAKVTKIMGGEVEDNAFIRLTFEDGEAIFSCSSTFGLDSELKVEYDCGWAKTDLNNLRTPVTYLDERSLLCRATGRLELTTGGTDNYLNQARHFVECVRDGTDCEVSKKEVMWGMEVLDEIYRGYGR